MESFKSLKALSSKIVSFILWQVLYMALKNLSIIFAVGTRFLRGPVTFLGFTRERSLTIRFVESGLEKLGLGHGAMVQFGFQKGSCGKWTGLKR